MLRCAQFWNDLWKNISTLIIVQLLGFTELWKQCYIGMQTSLCFVLIFGMVLQIVNFTVNHNLLVMNLPYWAFYTCKWVITSPLKILLVNRINQIKSVYRTHTNVLLISSFEPTYCKPEKFALLWVKSQY
jgi:hypothetical protein